MRMYFNRCTCRKHDLCTERPQSSHRSCRKQTERVWPVQSTSKGRERRPTHRKDTARAAALHRLRFQEHARRLRQLDLSQHQQHHRYQSEIPAANGRISNCPLEAYDSPGRQWITCQICSQKSTWLEQRRRKGSLRSFHSVGRVSCQHQDHYHKSIPAISTKRRGSRNLFTRKSPATPPPPPRTQYQGMTCEAEAWRKVWGNGSRICGEMGRGLVWTRRRSESLDSGIRFDPKKQI